MDAIREKVEEAIELIRPAVQSDGGDVELIDVVDSVVQVRLLGACNGCPSSTYTLHQGIERIVRLHVPEVTKVEIVY
jgi:Fe-S cluster biogenesis protein NfuA